MTATLLTVPDEKEGLSLAYVRALAARAGFSTSVPEPICASWRAGRSVRLWTCK